MQYMIM